MKKIKVISKTWYNQLEEALNEYVGKEGYEIKACYFDGKAHIAVLQKDEAEKN